MSHQMIAALNAYRVARIHHNLDEIAAADETLTRIEHEENKS